MKNTDLQNTDFIPMDVIETLSNSLELYRLDAKEDEDLMAFYDPEEDADDPEYERIAETDFKELYRRIDKAGDFLAGLRKQAESPLFFAMDEVGLTALASTLLADAQSLANYINSFFTGIQMAHSANQQMYVLKAFEEHFKRFTENREYIKLDKAS